MRKTRPFFGLSMLLISAVIFGFSEFPLEKGNPVFPLAHTANTPQTFSITGSPTVWFALTAENPNYFTTHQEFSGGSAIPNGAQQNIQYRLTTPFFAHPVFNSLDQRTLILQYLYPFHFFF